MTLVNAGSAPFALSTRSDGARTDDVAPGEGIRLHVYDDVFVRNATRTRRIPTRELGVGVRDGGFAYTVSDDLVPRPALEEMP